MSSRDFTAEALSVFGIARGAEAPKTVAADYHGGLHYPHLERPPGVADLLDAKLTALARMDSQGVNLSMREPNDAVRDHLVRVLNWEEAHVNLDKAVAGMLAQARGARPPGFERSAWQLLEHIRIAQEDILDFCLNAKYTHDLKWPDGYWPDTEAPPNDAAWGGSIAACARSRERLQQLALEVDDLTISVPTGKPNQTYLRALLLAADHVSYHVGQLVAVRKALGAWG